MATSTMPGLIMEGINTTVPKKVTDPRFSYKVSIPEGILDRSHDVLQTRMHLIMFYKKQSDHDGDSGWHVGGWIKETLGKALAEEPILAGRLARSEAGGDLEIVSNDSGVRVVEAQLPLSLEEFLKSKEKEQVESELVRWRDVGESNLQFSPLFYIQVTNFQCGGYSVGISHSLLLADPLRMAKFLNRWSEIHRSMAYDEGEIPKTPLFYAPNFAKRVACPPPAITTSSNANVFNSKTAIFNVSIEEKLDPNDENYKQLVLSCIKEAEGKFCLKMGSDFTLITKVPNGDNKIEIALKRGSFESPKSLKYELSSSSWEDLGYNSIGFRKNNLPVDVSHWVACNALGVVLVVISSPWEGKCGIKVHVTFPAASASS